LEHRGSEGFADLLEPSAPAETETPSEPAMSAAALQHELHAESTPEQMVRVRPDLTTGELKWPIEE
jgi:hypothetical protein